MRDALLLLPRARLGDLRNDCRLLLLPGGLRICPGGRYLGTRRHKLALEMLFLLLELTLVLDRQRYMWRQLLNLYRFCARW